MKNKKIVLTMTKTAKAHSVKSESGIDVFPDTDEGRQALIAFIVNNYLNAEVENGTQYKQVQ